jgi:ribokinase
VSESTGTSAIVQKKIVVVGSLNNDLVITLNTFPTEGQTVLGKALNQLAGGKGLNQAVAAKRAGGDVSLIGAVGDDSFGITLKEVLASEKIDDRVQVIADESSGAAVIEVDGAGSNRIIVIAGANNQLAAETVESQLRSVAETSSIGVVLVQSEIPLDSIQRALVVGKALGATTILNPAPIRDFTPEIYKHTDYLIPNEHEARALVTSATAQQDPLTSMLDCVDAANAIVDFGIKNVIVTRGEKGAVWANATGSGQASAFRIIPVDTVAAGDAFCGVFAHSINQGLPLAEALRWASAAGALAATHAGAVASIPQRLEIEQLLGA